MADRSNNNNQNNIDEVLQKVARALKGMKHGEVIVKVNDGKVVFVDRFERERVG